MEIIYTQDNDFFDKCESYLLESNIKCKQIMDMSTLISYLRNENADIVMIDYDYNPIDIKILEDLINSSFIDKDRFILISKNPELKILGVKIINRGYFIKDYKQIQSPKKNENVLTPLLVKDFVYDKLINLGLKPSHLGFHYLVELVLLVNEKRELINSLYYGCYDILALKFNTSISNIERNIRNAKTNMKEKVQNKILILNILKEIDKLNS